MKTLSVTAYEITAPGLDPIRLILQECGSYAGRVIIECFGMAWGTYFGAMGSDLKTFLTRVGPDYLLGALTNGRSGGLKREERYLRRIVEAIQSELKTP